MKRRNFLKALPAAALTLAGCGQHKTAPANTASLVFDHSYPLDYATQFSADCYEGGYVMIDIPDAGRFLVSPPVRRAMRLILPAGIRLSARATSIAAQVIPTSQCRISSSIAPTSPPP